jgi:signal transduction histidine kinase
MDLSTTKGSGLKHWLMPGAVIALLLVFVAAILLVPEWEETLGFVGMVIGLATAGVLYVRRSRSLNAPERRVWRLMAVGMLLVIPGVLIAAIMQELGVDVPAVGGLDAFFLGAYLILIVALIMFARLERGSREWLPTLLDAMVGGVSLAVLVWTAVFRELVESLAGAPWWQTAIAATYPILDVLVVIGLMIMIIRRSHFHLDIRLIFLALGLFSQVVSDFIFFRRGVGVTLAEADPEWSLLLIAAIMFVAGASVVDRAPKRREFPELDSPLLALIWPYLLSAALLGVHVSTYRTVAPDSDAVLLLDAVLAVGILIFLRQLLAIRRNQRRIEKQRSELVGSVSHELRTPLTAIVGYLNLLHNDWDDFPADARQEMIAEASNQADHMSRLVSDLVMLARGVHRNLPLEISEVALSSIVNSAMRVVEPSGTRIETDLASDAAVRVDPVRVQQALSNLLGNAVRYGGDTAILVSRIEGSDLVFEMHDNGDGVPTKYEALIWQRFERGANRLNATNPGLGIGLAIVEAIAVSHGGKASYRRSKRLGGACFTLVLPGCVAQPARRPPSSTPVSEPRPGARVSLGDPRSS